MQAELAPPMPLSRGDLREIDEVLVEYLKEGRVTPVYARERVTDEGQWDEITSTYLGQRLQRLAEHGHARNLYGVGLYELIKEPSD